MKNYILISIPIKDNLANLLTVNLRAVAYCYPARFNEFYLSMRGQTHFFISKKRFLVLFPIMALIAHHDFCCQAFLARMGIILPIYIYCKLTVHPHNLCEFFKQFKYFVKRQPPYRHQHIKTFQMRPNPSTSDLSFGRSYGSNAFWGLWFIYIDFLGF